MCFDFADYSILADVFVLRLNRSGDRVVRQRDDREDEVLDPSFEAFITRYLADPGSLF